MMKYLLLSISIIFSISATLNACSMYKVTKNGKTIVGNNEDWISPNNQFWFVPGEADEYGVMNVGLINNFAQGAINEAGLVYDGFANPYLEIKNTAGKANVSIGKAIQKIMHQYANVREVKKYLSTINLSSLTSSQVVFVDRSGEYLIVEGDELTIGNETEKTFSNFYYSQIKSIEEVELKNVQNGLAYLKTSTSEGSLDYCASVMKNLADPGGFTQYSTIYDLDQLTIRVHLYHDFNQSVEIDLKEALKKGKHKVMIADLFPKDSKGYQHYANFNNPENPTAFIKEWIGEEKQTEEELVKRGFANNINVIGYEWLYDKKDAAGAIKIFQYATELMPNNANLHDSLGEAFLVNKKYKEAIKSYSQSLALDPKNQNATDNINKIKKEQKLIDK